MVTEARIRLLICSVLLVLATILFFAPVIFSDNIFISRDHYLFYNPRAFFTAEAIRQGVLPLWNPYLGCGVAFQANLQSAVFYPLNAIYYVLPFQTGYVSFIIVHYVLGALFMFQLMRLWGSSHVASLYAGLVFAFGGYFASINDNVAFVTAGIWLPLVLACLHQALRTGLCVYALLTGLVLALQIYAGDASFCLLTSLICTAGYALCWQAGSQKAQPGSFLQPWKLLGIAWAVGAGLAAVQLVPFGELVSFSHRFGGLGWEQRTAHSLHPLELVQLLVPYPFGSTVPQTRWFGQMWLDTLYIGVWPCMFAAVFIVCCRGRLYFYLLLLTALGFFLALGKYNPLFQYAHWIIPGLNMIQFPVKFYCISSFALAVMAGKGLEWAFEPSCVQNRARALARAAFCMLLLVLALLMAGAGLQAGLEEQLGQLHRSSDYLAALGQKSAAGLLRGISMLGALLAAFLCLAVLAWKQPRLRRYALAGFVLLTFADLALVGKPADEYMDAQSISAKNETVRFFEQDTSLYRIYTVVRGDADRSFLHLYNQLFKNIYRVIQETLRPNLNLYHRVSAAGEYAELLNRAFYELFLPAERALKDPHPESSELAYCRRVLSLCNVKYLVSAYALPDPYFKLAKDGPIKIYENQDVLPRTFFVRRVELAASQQSVPGMMQAPDFDPRQVAYMSREEWQKLPAEAAAATDVSPEPPVARSIEVVAYELNRIELRIGEGRPGLLILADNYYPGWQAFIDHQEVPVVRVDHTLRGVWVGAGMHELRFLFKPKALIAGALITLATGIALAVGLTVLKRRDSQRRLAAGT